MNVIILKAVFLPAVYMLQATSVRFYHYLFSYGEMNIRHYKTVIRLDKLLAFQFCSVIAYRMPVIKISLFHA